MPGYKNSGLTKAEYEDFLSASNRTKCDTCGVELGSRYKTPAARKGQSTGSNLVYPNAVNSRYRKLCHDCDDAEHYGMAWRDYCKIPSDAERRASAASAQAKSGRYLAIS